MNLVPDIVGKLDPHQIRELERWFEAELRRVRNDPLTHGFPPHAGQELVHGSDHRFRLLISANRWGKSLCGMREILWLATMTHPYQDCYPMDMVWVGFPDFPFYRRVTKKLFHEWCPKDRLVSFHETHNMAVVRREDGGTCEIHFLSYDTDREKWQGASVDLCWLDEECPEDIFREAMARLIDKDGRMLMTLTPVSGMGWIYDRLYLPAVNGTANIELIQGALAERDDTKPHGVGRVLVPHLSYEQILRFAEAIPDEDERAIRIHGEFRARSGAVYKQFRPEIHVVPRFRVPDHWELFAGVDPGYHGFAVVLCAMSDDGRIYVIDEYFSQEETLRVRAPAIWEMVKRHRSEQLLADEYLPIYVDTEDPQFVTEINLWAEDHNVPLSFASLQQGMKARKAGILRLQQLLDLHPTRSTPVAVARPRSELGEPMLYVVEGIETRWRLDEDSVVGCRLTWEMARYLWKKPPKDAPHPEDADERSAGGAHMLAALRYAVMARLGAVAPPTEDPLSHLSPRDRRVWEDLHEKAEQWENRSS